MGKIEILIKTVLLFVLGAFTLTNCASVQKNNVYKESTGFLVYDDPKFCYFLEVEGTATTDDCFKSLTLKSTNEAILVPYNWIDQIGGIISSIDTIKVTNIPEGFNPKLYSLHYVPVTARYQVLYEKSSKKNRYTYIFENGQLHFYARHWANYDIEIRPAAFCK
jgi:hypothetical protein